MAKALIELFKHYARIEDYETRKTFSFENPRLLAKTSILELLNELPRRSDINKSRLVEIDGMRMALNRDPYVYKLGYGPIERLLVRFHRAEISLQQAIEMAGDDDIVDALSPLYIHAVSWQSGDMAKGSQWHEAVLISRLLIEAALQRPESEIVDQAIVESVVGNIQIAIFALTRGPDPTIFNQALILANRLLKRAETLHSKFAIGMLLHSLGVLFGDIYTVPGSVEENTGTVNIEEWFNRPTVEPGLFASLGDVPPIPEPVASLRAAVAYFQSALAYRDGLKKGLTYKAIAQTLDFQEAVFADTIDDTMLRNVCRLASDLLVRHPDAEKHLTIIRSISDQRGYPQSGQPHIADTRAKVIMTIIESLPQPDAEWLQPRRKSKPVESASDVMLTISSLVGAKDLLKDVKESHHRAVHDLGRALAYELPFALYLRNFDTANEIHRLGDPIIQMSESKSGRKTMVHIDPNISYSIVDHKALQLFPEGVIGICDPNIPTFFHRQTLIAMLAIPNDKWQGIVAGLIEVCCRVIMLLDDITPGVEFELETLQELGAAKRTLIVTGQGYRSKGAALPDSIARGNFPHVVDWVDFGYNESYHSMQHKAHDIVRHVLPRFVRKDVSEIVEAWIDGSVAPAALTSVHR